MDYAQRVLSDLKQNYPGQSEYIQAASEILTSANRVLTKHPEFEDAAVLERLMEAERLIIMKVTWMDDKNKIHVNRAYRVQFNSALGPYKGGLRFHPSVNLSIIRFLGLEQTIKNALTGLPMGGAKGGSDFNPRGKSDREVMRFCRAFMTELYRHIGPQTDVPASDIGVGAREVGYLFGQYKRIMNETSGVLTGKGLSYGGSLGRSEATGYGLLYLVRNILNDRKNGLEDKKVVISGSGNVAYYAAEKAQSFGAKVIALSDSDGFIHDPNGIQLDVVNDIKHVRRGRIREYANLVSGSRYTEGKGIWHLPCDIALPCATQNELHERDAEVLAKNGCLLVAEGANMPTTQEAIHVLHNANVIYVPGKASNAGGVAVSGLEMSQNAQHLSWTAEEVDMRLQEIMRSIHNEISEVADEYGQPDNYEFGANAAGFLRVATAMQAQGF